MTAPVIAAIDAGTYYHHHTFQTPAIRRYLDHTIYLPELSDAALDACDALIVSCRTHPDLLVAQRARLARFLAAGKTLVAMGETASHRWLDAVVWTPCEVNFWWWKTPGADSGLRVAAPGHALWRYLTLDDATWHQHGTFAPPPGATSLIDKVGAGSVLYEHHRPEGGRLIVTSLDPMYHHGSHFMPATSRFLPRFLHWLHDSTPALRRPRS